MVGVDMGIDGVEELESKLGEQQDVALDLLEHGVDQDGLAGVGVGKQVGECGSLAVEELAEEHGASWSRCCGREP